MADNVSVIDEASFMDLLMNGLIDRVDALESKVELLEGKFDAWQKLVESILGTAQTAIAHDSNLLSSVAIWTTVIFAGVAIITAISIAVMNRIANKKKEDAVSDAIKEINEILAKGALPGGSKLLSKIVDSIINTDEFKKNVEDTLDKYNTLASKSFYDNVEDIDKTDETTLDSKSLKKTDTNNEG